MADTAKKIRVYELARDLGVSSAEVLRRLRGRGNAVTSHASAITSEVAGEVRAAMAADARRAAAEPRARGVVVRRRPRPAPELPAEPRPTPQPSPEPQLPLHAVLTPATEAARTGAGPVETRQRFELELAAARARTEARRAAEAAAPVTGPVSPPSSRARVIEVPARPERRPHRRAPGAPVRSRRDPHRPSAQTRITTPAEHKRVIRVQQAISVNDLAHQLGTRATDLLARLWRLGGTAANVNTALDLDAATLLASELGYEVRDVGFHEERVLQESADRPENLRPRAPVVTIMGHVDHGKTTLLDVIRDSRVAAAETGGITQHIGAYRVASPSAGELVFIDTPGHEAFAAMRARGAGATDVVVLVVAADDGVMPQTLEALDHARQAGAPIVVAITKCDLPAARLDMVRSQLAERGLVPEAWGGDTQYIAVSAFTGQGIPALLEAIALQAAVLDLRASTAKPAAGVVLEARLDRGRGPVATALIQQGTLRRGDTVVCGEHVGRVRTLIDDRGRVVTEAGPSMPVEIVGLDGVPDAGDPLHAADEAVARRIAAHRREQRRQRVLGASNKLSLQAVMDKIRATGHPELKAVVKADTQGTAEALRDALARLSTPAVSVDVIRSGVGAITESDVQLAVAAGAVVIGFRVRPVGKAAALAHHEGVEIRLHQIIYDAVDDLRRAMTGLLPRVERERDVGRVEVRQVYRIPRVGTVGGCHVLHGSARRGALVRVVRDGVQIHRGRIGSLRRFKEDVNDVGQGYDCGIAVDRLDDLRPGDVLEIYDVVMERAAA